MAEPKKPFACCVADCGMTFTNEDHLNIHTKKHDMILHLGLGQKASTFVADQTPTPTRFIRNCEEVGLFQDLQNVNPFDETFKRAMDTKSGIALSLDGSLSEILSDDALHTPNIFSHLPEDSPTAIFKTSQGATDLRTNLSINRSSSDESAVIVKSLCSQNDKTIQTDILTTSKLVETQSLGLDGESSKVTIVRQDSLELAQSVLDTNIRKEGDLLSNVEVKFRSNFEIKQALQNSEKEANLPEIDKSMQIPLISITDSSTSEFPNENQEKMKCIIIEKDVMLTKKSKSELNVVNHIKKNCVELISQKSLDFAIDSLTSGCLRRIDLIEDHKPTSYLEKNDKPIESNNLINKMKSNLQSVLHNAIEKHAIDKHLNNLAKSKKQKVASNRNSFKNTRKVKDIFKRRNSDSSDDSLKCKNKKHKMNDSDSEYEITLKLPNGKKVWMKPVDAIKERNSRSSDDVNASNSKGSEQRIDYTEMSDAKQKLKDAINIKKCYSDNSGQSLTMAKDTTALNKLYANASKGFFLENVEITLDPRNEISTVACTTHAKDNSLRTYILPGNIIPVIEPLSHVPPKTNMPKPAMASLQNTNQSNSSNTSNTTKLNTNTQLLPYLMTNTNTALSSNKPTTSLNTKTQTTSVNNIIGNVLLMKTTPSSTNVDSNAKILPQNITNTNTFLPSNKPATIQSTSANNLPGNVIFINTKHITSEKLGFNEQSPNIMTYTNNVLKPNKLATNLAGKTSKSSSNNVARNVIFINAKENPIKLDAKTQPSPNIQFHKKTVLPSNKINPKDGISKPIMTPINISSNGKCKIGIPKEQNVIKEQTQHNKTKASAQSTSRQERQNAAVQRYRKRQSELKLNLAKKNLDLRAQNEKLTRELTMAHQEIAQLRGILETHKKCILHSSSTGAPVPRQPIQLQRRYIIVTPEILQSHNGNPPQSVNMNHDQIEILSSGNEDIGIAEEITVQHTEAAKHTS